MTTLAQDRPLTNGSSSAADKPIVLKRRTIDSILIGVGAVLTVALVVAGALLSWGAGFSADYVGDELSSQNITFAPAERSAEHTSERPSLMRISYAVLCLK